jgi:hypothetical protein
MSHDLLPVPIETPEDAGKTLSAAGATGGPQSEAGKARSRFNAIKHGLTATTLLPEVLDGGLLERHKRRLQAEWRPASLTQEFLVAELARHAAALELVEQAEVAVLRCGARGAPGILLSHDTHEEENVDTMLAAAVTTDALDRLTRYRRSHEKGWHAALLRLREAKALDRPPKETASERPRIRFRTEDECEAYLILRAQRGDRRCPHCGHGQGHWLQRRRRWQCGPRVGTVMERSSLPLTRWFAAIQRMLQNDNVTTEELATVTGIRRMATVRLMAKKIREGLRSDRARELLAGLSEVFRPEPPS